MDITIRGKHFDVPERVQARARDKFSRLQHYLPLLNEGVCEVDLAHEKAKEPDRRFVVHVNVSGHGVHLRVEAHATDPEAAIDHAAQMLSRQAQRHKDRLYRRGRGRAPKGALPAPEATAPEGRDYIARVKHLALKPMTEVEAREQMEALGHDFFVFHHTDLEQITVLYRRHGEEYGLIIPEIS
ncbi:MAG: ribosome-associated translation inhibitor RaiA [Chloroflexi bacterium]|nr:ribosome-associated translation inhibitor RaiA [Chloroflexota bacterium]